MLGRFRRLPGAERFGLGAAKLIETGHAVCVLWVAAILLVLLLSGVRNAVAHGARAEDAGLLSAMTHLPRLLWAELWIAGTLLEISMAEVTASYGEPPRP